MQELCNAVQTRGYGAYQPYPFMTTRSPRFPMLTSLFFFRVQINWNTNLADSGCKLRFYGGRDCIGEVKSFGWSDYYGDLGENAKSYAVTGSNC